MSKRVTIADVAETAGVSLMTVSRVINNKGDVSAETAERIWQIIDEMGYRPSRIARGLARNRTSTIGLVVPDIGNPFFSDVARGVEHRAYAEGYNVFLCNTDEDPQRELAVLNSLEDQQVAGLIVCSSRLDKAQLAEKIAHFPTAVLVNRRLDNSNALSVMVDDEAGGKTAVSMLLQNGHRAIGFLTGPPHSESSRQRRKGYEAAYAEMGLSFNPDWLYPSPANVNGLEQITSALLHEHPEITALFCHNDLVAVGAMKACWQLGKTVPRDIAIVGFDDIPLADLIMPALTTCRVPRYQLGQQSMALLLAQMADAVSGENPLILKTELIVRQSAP